MPELIPDYAVTIFLGERGRYATITKRASSDRGIPQKIVPADLLGAFLVDIANAETNSQERVHAWFIGGGENAVRDSQANAQGDGR